MSFELAEPPRHGAVIKVIGVGGGGGNAVQHMLQSGVPGVDFIAANTDVQALRTVEASTLVPIGKETTKGLGAGANPEVGRAAAMEDRELLQDAISGTDMLFITAGMGGGTGTGAAPVIAQIARDLEILTVAVVTKPFTWENRAKRALEGIEELKHNVDSVITIPNDKLVPVMGEQTSLEDGFAAVDDVLLGAVQGIADIIVRPGIVNVDFADVCTVMREHGIAIMGTARAAGADRAREATDKAVKSPLLDDVELHDARAVLVNITAAGTGSMNIGELTEVGNMVREFAAKDATVVVGTAVDSEIGDDMRVTVVATGLGWQKRQQPGLVVNNPEPVPPKSGSEYGRYEQPAIGRARGAAATDRANDGQQLPHDMQKALDLPAFLRRNAS